MMKLSVVVLSMTVFVAVQAGGKGPSVGKYISLIKCCYYELHWLLRFNELHWLFLLQ